MGGILKRQPIFSGTLLGLFILGCLAAPGAGAGLTVLNGNEILTTHGETSPVFTITDAPLLDGASIIVDISGLKSFTTYGALSDTDVIVWSTTVDPNIVWFSSVIDPDTLVLTGSGGDTQIGDTVTLTFSGALGNPWIADTGGEQTIPLTATRSDGGGSDTISFMIKIPAGLSITDGQKIIATDGETSPVITITDASIAMDDTITIDVQFLNLANVANGPLTDKNILITDNAAAADWTATLSGDILTLTSTGGPTAVGENITLTFTGANTNPWASNQVGIFTLTATRTDGNGGGDFSFDIATPPAGITVAGGTKITQTTGSTSTEFIITGAPVSQDGTITIDVSSLHQYVAGTVLSDANIMISDTAASADWTGSITGDILKLTSTGGPTAFGEAVTLTFTGANQSPWIPNTHGQKSTSLLAVRDDTGMSASFDFIIETAPPPGFIVMTGFSGSPVSGSVPLTVSFTDESLGNPDTWNWSFGDDAWFNTTDPALKNPGHTYTSFGFYTVKLTASNLYGSNFTTRVNYIHALNSAVLTANTTITGLTITNCGGPQTVTVDSSVLHAALIPNNSVLEIQPPVDRGLGNITIYALNGVGFTRSGTSITGTPTAVHLVSGEIAPSPSFSPETGSNASLNWSADLLFYPCNAVISTRIWEGGTAQYDPLLERIATGNSATVFGTAYTAKVTRTNFPSNAAVNLHMSVNSTWNPSQVDGTGRVFIWRIADDEGSGQILPTTFLSNDPHEQLDYFTADSPYGMSTFGLSSIAGNNNPFQLITLTIAAHVPASEGPVPLSGNAGDDAAPAATATPNSPAATPTQTIVSPQSTVNPQTVTTKLYTNKEGLITQATSLHSSDGFVTLFIGTGIVAKDREGKPLSSVSLTPVPAGNLPGTLPGNAFAFTGRAYELKPEGAVFSPAINLTFTLPLGAQFGQDFSVKSYDGVTGTWQDMPIYTDTHTATITAQISHFGTVALFTKSMTTEPTAVAPQVPTTAAEMKGAAAPSTAMSTTAGMVRWAVTLLADNIVLLIVIIILIAAVVFYDWKQRLYRWK